MNQILLIFIIIISILAIAITIIGMYSIRKNKNQEDSFYDEKGQHIYYERSLIKKQEFHKEHPEMPYSEMRSFRNLFLFKKLFRKQTEKKNSK